MWGLLGCMKGESPPEMLSAKKFLWVFSVGHYQEGKTMPNETVVCIRAG